MGNFSMQLQRCTTTEEPAFSSPGKTCASGHGYSAYLISLTRFRIVIHLGSDCAAWTFLACQPSFNGCNSNTRVSSRRKFAPVASLRDLNLRRKRMTKRTRKRRKIDKENRPTN